MYNVNSTRLPDWRGHSLATHPLDDGLIVNVVDKLVFIRCFFFPTPLLTVHRSTRIC
jgi:hypothetical protein